MNVGPSTRKKLNWRAVRKGEQVTVACEGGFINEVTVEPGVVLQVEGSAGVYVPLSMVDDVFEYFTRGPDGPVKKKARKR